MFTGAGISVSSGVPDMFHLEQLINEAFNPMNDYVIELIENKSENRLAQVKKLHGLFVYSEPSISHLRIADLCNLYSYDLITGNLDGLHEKTGITPQYYTEEKHVVDNLGGYELLLTIGLGDEGNINLTDKYRKANPLGKVIAINKERPQYLGSNDYLIAGDSDEILEKLCNQLNDNGD
nr:Sir2 family NAD-dependent protein deacetylase [Paenibacillus mangrovi]